MSIIEVGNYEFKSIQYLSNSKGLMQIYAYDEEGNEQISHFAQKNSRYTCLECRGQVALRSGPFVRPHFYHLGKERPCRIRFKTPAHLQIQARILELLPKGEARMERAFPEIGRIADVAWEKKQIIFEIQVSFISLEEVESRNKDYQKLGYQVVWILHETRFNRRRITAAEYGLINKTHYFTDIDKDGKGRFYDQFSFHHKGLRSLRVLKCQVNLSEPLFRAELTGMKLGELQWIKSSREKWPLYFRGDIWTSASAGQVFDPHELKRAIYADKKCDQALKFSDLKCI